MYKAFVISFLFLSSKQAWFRTSSTFSNFSSYAVGISKVIHEDFWDKLITSVTLRLDIILTCPFKALTLVVFKPSSITSPVKPS